MQVNLTKALDVSHETEEKLRSLAALLAKWNPAINLVAKSTLSEAWNRHIVDSAQLYTDTAFRRWVDLGSGGGFPGLVIATIAAEKNPGGQVILVESDQRKATFLRQAIRNLGLGAQVIAERIESINPLGADILSARALAPLESLCGFAARHLAREGVALFPKGIGWRAEEEAARKIWSFDLDLLQSETDPSAVILKLKAIHHV